MNCLKIFFYCIITCLIPEVNATDCPEDKARLQIHITGKRVKTDTLSPIHIYHNGKQFKTLVLPSRFRGTIDIECVDTGEYSFEYLTIFRNTSSVTIKVTEARLYELEFHREDLGWRLPDFTPLIDQLTVSDSFTILRTSTGCFHTYTDIITIRRSTDGYQAVFADQICSMNDTSIFYFRQFERDVAILNHNKKSAFISTTRISYSFLYHGMESKEKEATCLSEGWKTFLGTLTQNKRR